MTDIAEFVSLVLTFPTIFLAIAVVYAFGGEALHATKSLLQGRIPAANSLLILGITVSFLGGILDNTYWWIAWASQLFDLPSKEYWFANGVYSNVPFRQGAGILAAVLHIYAAYGEKFSKPLKIVGWVTLLMGTLLAWVYYSGVLNG